MSFSVPTKPGAEAGLAGSEISSGVGSGACETVTVALGTMVGVVVGSVRGGVGVGEDKLVLVAWLPATTGVWFGERRWVRYFKNPARATNKAAMSTSRKAIRARAVRIDPFCQRLSLHSEGQERTRCGAFKKPACADSKSMVPRRQSRGVEGKPGLAS